jgi:predicted nucleotidyltransferase
MFTPPIILSGVVGSTAFGLARAGSDIDRLGIFVRPTQDFFQIGGHGKDTLVTTAPDSALHEVGKYVSLALKCNPTIMDLMYLPEYEVCTTMGEWLVNIREDFLSEKYVRSAYGGYAIGQIKRIKQEMANDQRHARIAKHARHCYRLLEQGRELLETGSLTVRVSDPDAYWSFDVMETWVIDRMFVKAFERFEAAKSVLPQAPRTERLQVFINAIRGV